jgi:hypothetical protein
MGYSEWINISEPSNCNEPAVYKIRLTNNEGFVVSINRFIGRDEEGILQKITRVKFRNQARFFYENEHGMVTS